MNVASAGTRRRRSSASRREADRLLSEGWAADRLLSEGWELPAVFKHLEVAEATYRRRNPYGGMRPTMRSA
jgi:hypothetical protein